MAKVLVQRDIYRMIAGNGFGSWSGVDGIGVELWSGLVGGTMQHQW